jgi:hypothetical protein
MGNECHANPGRVIASDVAAENPIQQGPIIRFAGTPK